MYQNENDSIIDKDCKAYRVYRLEHGLCRFNKLKKAIDLINKEDTANEFLSIHMATMQMQRAIHMCSKYESNASQLDKLYAVIDRHFKFYVATPEMIKLMQHVQEALAKEKDKDSNYKSSIYGINCRIVCFAIYNKSHKLYLTKQTPDHQHLQVIKFKSYPEASQYLCRNLLGATTSKFSCFWKTKLPLDGWQVIPVYKRDKSSATYIRFNATQALNHELDKYNEMFKNLQEKQFEKYINERDALANEVNVLSDSSLAPICAYL